VLAVLWKRAPGVAARPVRHAASTVQLPLVWGQLGCVPNAREEVALGRILTKARIARWN